MIIKSKNRGGKRTTLMCKRCKNLFSELDIRIRAGGGKFCSNYCYQTYRAENRLDRKERNKLYQKKNKYGLDFKEYENMVKETNGMCPICGYIFTNENRYTGPFVDHNHETGKVRGILCNRCNRTLGFVDDKIEILENLIVYLRNRKD